MTNRILQRFRNDLWRNLFYASLALLALALAYRILSPPWVYFGSTQRGYYQMNRWTGETYYLRYHRAIPLRYERDTGGQAAASPDAPE